MKKDFPKFPCDVLVIGTGAAGCAAAITAAEKTAKVLLVNKGTFGRSGTTCLGSVVYAAGLGHTDERDTPDCHFLDTIVEGRYLGNQELVKILAEEAPRTVYDLERYGVS
jgi:succinate dehydrogenase/fumarate reductase flavoprotein subunit